METISYTLPPEQDGATVRHILKAALHVSSHAISRLTRTENGIRVNGIHARTVDILHTGDVLEVDLPAPPPGARGPPAGWVFYTPQKKTGRGFANPPPHGVFHEQLIGPPGRYP